MAEHDNKHCHAARFSRGPCDGTMSSVSQRGQQPGAAGCKLEENVLGRGRVEFTEQQTAVVLLPAVKGSFVANENPAAFKCLLFIFRQAMF